MEDGDQDSNEFETHQETKREKTNGEESGGINGESGRGV